MHSLPIIVDDPQFPPAVTNAVLGAADLCLVGVADNVLLVDVGSPSGNGLDLIRHANHHLPKCDEMVVTVFGDVCDVLQCIESGAALYLFKDSKSIDIVDQIPALRDGGGPIGPVIVRKISVGARYALRLAQQYLFCLEEKGLGVVMVDIRLVIGNFNATRVLQAGRRRRLRFCWVN